MEGKDKNNFKRLESGEPLHHNLLNEEYLGAFKSKKEAKKYFLSNGMSKSDYIWLEGQKNLFDERELRRSKVNTNASVSVNGNDSDTYKRGVNPKLNLSKSEVITRLKQCGYRTPPKKVASLLEQLFRNNSSREGHWLYIAQHWTPRAINRVISVMSKQRRLGEVSIFNPAAYFTKLIKFRKKRKRVTSTNDTHKQQILND